MLTDAYDKCGWDVGNDARERGEMRGGWVRSTALWRRGVGLVVGVTGAALLAGCGNAQSGLSGGGIPVPPAPSVSATAPSALASTPASAPGSAVVIRVSLDRTRVVAGEPIRGHAVVTNTTAKPILIHACSTGNGWVLVGLTNGTTGYDPFISYDLCAPSRLAPGSHRYRVAVATTYQWCLGPGGKSPLIPVPKCLPNGRPPPLPAGTYVTKVVAPGLPAGTSQAPPVTVTLLPPSGSR